MPLAFIKPLTKKSVDCSDLGSFSFGFYCDCCGKEWKSQPLSFENGGFTTIKHEDIRNLLWLYEHQTAYDRANLEAHFHFNNCPVCGKWVCDDCFCIERKNGSKCRGCDSK